MLAWVAGVALGVAAAAVQILPFLEYLSASAVAAYRQEYMWRLFLPPRAAIALLMPFYYGTPMGDDFWGPVNFNELTTSVGLVPLVALPLALALAWRRAGVQFRNELEVGPGGKQIQVLDPDGNSVELFEPAR